MSTRETEITLVKLPLQNPDDIVLQASLLTKYDRQPIQNEPVVWRKFNSNTQQWDTILITPTDGNGVSTFPLYMDGKWQVLQMTETTTFSALHPETAYPQVIYMLSASNPIDISLVKPKRAILGMPSAATTGIIVVGGIIAVGVGYYFLVYKKKHHSQPLPQTPMYAEQI